jgi:hypothetical protein
MIASPTSLVVAGFPAGRRSVVTRLFRTDSIAAFSSSASFFNPKLYSGTEKTFAQLQRIVIFLRDVLENADGLAGDFNADTVSREYEYVQIHRNF